VAIDDLRAARLAAGNYTLCRADGTQEAAKVHSNHGLAGLKRVDDRLCRCRRYRRHRRHRGHRHRRYRRRPGNPKALPALRTTSTTITMVSARTTHLGRAARENSSPRASCASGFSWSKRKCQPSHRRYEQPIPFQVTGAAEFQLAIIIETMRREGLQAVVSTDLVTRRLCQAHEPVELLVIDIAEDFIGVVSQLWQCARQDDQK